VIAGGSTDVGAGAAVVTCSTSTVVRAVGRTDGRGWADEGAEPCEARGAAVLGTRLGASAGSADVAGRGPVAASRAAEGVAARSRSRSVDVADRRLESPELFGE
jgi:hypothetical protein